MTTDLRFTVEVATTGANAWEHHHVKRNRIAKEREALRLAWIRSGVAAGVDGLLVRTTVLRLPVGIPMKTRRLAKLAGHDLRRVDAVVYPARPLDVHLTRVSWRELDPFENLPHSLKGIVDEIARQMGINDRDPIVRWIAHQERGPRKYHAVKVQIVAREAPQEATG